MSRQGIFGIGSFLITSFATVFFFASDEESSSKKSDEILKQKHCNGEECEILDSYSSSKI